MTPAPIRPSSADLERRRLESTLDQDLASLSADSFPPANFTDTSADTVLGSRARQQSKQPEQPNYHIHEELHTIGETSFPSNTTLSMEYPRGFGEGETTVMYEQDGVMYRRSQARDRFPSNPYNRDGPFAAGPPAPVPESSYHATHPAMNFDFPSDMALTPRPRQTSRKASGMSAISSVQQSPTSTAGHHVSQVTLADKVFQPRHGRGTSEASLSDGESEFDAERSINRLVGALSKVLNDSKTLSRPRSPFSPASPPRSPSPLPSMMAAQNGNADLSFQYAIGGMAPIQSSPSRQRKASGSATDASRRSRMQPAQTPFKSTGMASNNNIATSSRPAPRRVLSESSAHNIAPAPSAGPAFGRTPKAKKPTGGRIAALRDENGEIRRPKSAPGGRAGDMTVDVTGLTGLLETPVKGGKFDSLDKNADVGPDNQASGIPAALATLQARLRALENENSLSRRRVKELEAELEKAKQEVRSVRHLGDRRLKEVIGEKTALEDLVASLRSHVARITSELEDHTALVAELRAAQSNRTRRTPSPPRYSQDPENEVQALRRDVDRLDREVTRLRGIVEEGLETRRKGRNHLPDGDAEVDLLGRDEPMGDGLPKPQVPKQRFEARLEPDRLPSKLRQGMHASASARPTTMPPTERPKTRVSHAPPTPDTSGEDGYHSPTPASRSASATSFAAAMQDKDNRKAPNAQAKARKEKARVSDVSDHSRSEGPDSPFPSIRAEDEHEFFALSEAAQNANRKSTTSHAAKVSRSEPVRRSGADMNGHRAPNGGAAKRYDSTDDVPPQTVLARVIRELEEDYAHLNAIFSELAEQYKVLDAASASAKHHVLADHLKEVIDTMKQKADQITALYDLLEFQDKPLPKQSKADRATREQHKTKHDVMRMVRESLGDEAFRRLGLNSLRSRQEHAVV